MTFTAIRPVSGGRSAQRRIQRGPRAFVDLGSQRAFELVLRFVAAREYAWRTKKLSPLNSVSMNQRAMSSVALLRKLRPIQTEPASRCRATGRSDYDVSPDGQRFVMVKDHSASGRLNIVLNWVEKLKRLVPAK